MVVHERQHRGDRPYICPQCGKGFTHVSNVKRHIRFHNGEKPYQCGKCPARFTTSTDLRRHMNSRRCMTGSIKAASRITEIDDSVVFNGDGSLPNCNI
ncbi:AGAP003990-PA-like protein [Anopheles sinensis]|nr:AGAP003990-PA-like protein [Anopheles sinensis]